MTRIGESVEAGSRWELPDAGMDEGNEWPMGLTDMGFYFRVMRCLEIQ